MKNIALIGIDLGKKSFHIHCQDRHGKAIYRKKFRLCRVKAASALLIKSDLDKSASRH